jgi:hypothetical protein
LKTTGQGQRQEKNLDRLVNSLCDRVVDIDNDADSDVHHRNVDTDIDHWKGKKIIPLNEWKKITYSDGSPLARGLRLDEGLQYFPSQYDDFLFCVGVPNGYEDKVSGATITCNYMSIW